MKEYKVEWIDIYDEMPKESEMVLCHVLKDKAPSEVHVGRWNGKFWVVGNFFEWDIGKVTHWHPKPSNKPKKWEGTHSINPNTSNSSE